MLCLTTLGYIHVIMCIHVDGAFDWQFNSWFKTIRKVENKSVFPVITIIKSNMIIQGGYILSFNIY